MIYTDGVTEAWDEYRNEFGEARLLSIIHAAGADRSALVLANIMRHVDQFVGAAAQHDDITCMVVRRT